MLSLLVESTQDFQSKLIEVMSEESNMQDQINMLFRDLNAARSRLSEVRMIRNRSRGIPGMYTRCAGVHMVKFMVWE